jgi:hypothetical protein
LNKEIDDVQNDGNALIVIFSLWRMVNDSRTGKSADRNMNLEKGIRVFCDGEKVFEFTT